jgi:hypothetical protein
VSAAGLTWIRSTLMVCAGGTLMEVVHIAACRGEDIDQWVASFPVIILTAGGSVQSTDELFRRKIDADIS